MLQKLAPRERQIVDFLYARGESTAGAICEGLENAPSGSAVRAMLARLEAKGFVERKRVEKLWVYAAAVPEESAQQSSMSQLLSTFFNGRPAVAASAFLGMSEDLEAEELDELERLIAQARKGRSK